MLNENSNSEPSGPDEIQGDQPTKRVRAEAADLGVLWTVATILGILAIVFVPIPASAPRPWLRMGLPIVVMLLFAALAWSRAAHSKQRVADSLYFMGFLWTLAALIHALLSSPDPTSTLIYTAFGYSLIGTFSGMFLRLMMMQFARDLDSQEREAVDKIDNRVAELDRALVQAANAVGSFGQSLVPAGSRLEDSLVSAAKAWGEESKKLSDGLAAHVRQGLDNDLRALGKSVTALGNHCSAIEEQLRSVTDQLSTPGQEFIGSLELAAAGMKRQAAALTSALEQLITTVQLAPNDPRMVESFADAKLRLDELTTAMNGAAIAFRDTGIASSEAEAGIAAAAAAADRAGLTIAKASKFVATTSTSVAETAKQLQESMAAANEDSKEVETTLREVIDFVDHRVVNRS